ncbi:hypothetical protein ACOSQ2_004334 [Xanthoceras sorbifolium]
MDSDEIATLCESLSLSDDDGPVLQIGGDKQKEGIRDVNHCLVGKVLSRKRVNRDAFKAIIIQIWGTMGFVEVEAVGDNVFVFFFRKIEDLTMVWNRGPWHFDKCLLILEKPSGLGEISKMKFQYVDF